MRTPKLIILYVAALVAIVTAGCSKSSTNSVILPPKVANSKAVETQLEKIQKDYGVVLDVHSNMINIRTGLITTDKRVQIKDELHKAFGEDFTNYTINYNVF